MGVGVSFRYGSSRTKTRCLWGTRFEAEVLQAALDAGIKVREPRPRDAKVRPAVDWVARAGITVPASADPDIVRTVCRRTVEYAAGRAMFCGCGAVLDATRAWVVERDGKTAVECDRCHESNVNAV